MSNDDEVTKFIKAMAEGKKAKLSLRGGTATFVPAPDVEMKGAMTCSVCGEPMALNAACVFERSETDEGTVITQRHFTCGDA